MRKLPGSYSAPAKARTVWPTRVRLTRSETFGWDLSTDAGKIELAQDVAGFGNGEQDAVIIVEMATSKVSGTEVLVRGPGQTFNAKVAQRHHRVLDQDVPAGRGTPGRGSSGST